MGFRPRLTPDLFHRLEYDRDIDESSRGFNLLDILEIPKQGTPGYCIDTHRAAYWKGSINPITQEAPVLAVVVARERRLRDEATWSFGVVDEVSLRNHDPAMRCIEAAEYGAPDLLLALDALEQFVKPNRAALDALHA
jgi:hypothetical protein